MRPKKYVLVLVENCRHNMKLSQYIPQFYPAIISQYIYIHQLYLKYNYMYIPTISHYNAEITRISLSKL